MSRTKRFSALKLTQLAMLTALVIALQFIGTFIKIGPLPLSLVLVPIVIGACLLGAGSGLFLGFVFGAVTMIMGVAGIDAFSNMLFVANPAIFIILCFLKAMMAGWVAGLIYKALGKAFGGKYKALQTCLASISAPIVNTGIFVVGMILFFTKTANELSSVFPEYVNAVQIIVLGLAGFNFIGEFIVNLVLSPVIVRVIEVVNKKIKF